jgi:hypothetical protein
MMLLVVSLVLPNLNKTVFDRCTITDYDPKNKTLKLTLNNHSSQEGVRQDIKAQIPLYLSARGLGFLVFNVAVA